LSIDTSGSGATIGSCANYVFVCPSNERIADTGDTFVWGRSRIRDGGDRTVKDTSDSSTLNALLSEALILQSGIVASQASVFDGPIIGDRIGSSYRLTDNSLTSSKNGFGLFGDDTLTIGADSDFAFSSRGSTTTDCVADTGLKIAFLSAAVGIDSSGAGVFLEGCTTSVRGNNSVVIAISSDIATGNRLTSLSGARGIAESTTSGTAGSNRGKTTKTSSNINRVNVKQVLNGPSLEHITRIGICY